MHILAENLGVNVKYLFYLIARGKEPTDQTENGRAVRIKMFLPRRKRRKRGEPVRQYTEPPEYITWWKKQPKQVRHDIILQAKAARDE